MFAKELISDIIQPLKTSNVGNEALHWMGIFKVSHLPIVNNREFLGLISESDIFDLNMSDVAIGAHSLSLSNSFVYHDQHIYEVIDIVAKNKLTVIPVLDRDNVYKGSISIFDLVQSFAKLINSAEQGSIIVLELNSNDYHLSEIARIIEENDAKILGLYLNNIPDSTKLDLTLKINVVDITSIIHTFNRYDYTIKFSFLEKDLSDDVYKDRYDEFINYMNI